MATDTIAQNFGLTVPQSMESLPKSAVDVVQPSRKPKVLHETKLMKTGDQQWKITNGWELAEASTVISGSQTIFSKNLDTSDWYNATVPGTVLTTLVEQGVYPDPYFGINNLSIPESLCRTDWWYRTRFQLPENPDNKLIWLLLDGINYRADVWLNGQKLGRIDGAFIRGRFEISSLVKTFSENILAVHIYPPNNPGIPHEQSVIAGRGPNGGQLCLDGPTFISSEGWDWVPGIRDRNIGIWQDVSIKYTRSVSLGDMQVISDLPLPDTTSAKVFIRADVANNSDKVQKANIHCRLDGREFVKPFELKSFETKTIEFSPDEFPKLNLENPRLWWPNGYGSPNLYDLEVLLINTENQTCDQQSLKFGIREMSYVLSVDAPDKQAWRVEYAPTDSREQKNLLFDNQKRRDVGEGVSVSSLREGADESVFRPVEDQAAPYLVIKVNGKPIFCRGGNWGMDDAMKNVSREHLEPYFKLHRDAHFNMVRNWTGESTEEVFYQLCDEYGLLVWNDFWLSTEGYNLNVNDDDLFIRNAKDVIRRFRNHPSIAIWCPRNEGYAPESLEDRIAQLILDEDGTRYYQPNSRYLNLRPSGPWHYFKDPAEYFRENAKGFNTEQGTPSVPTAASMRKMMAEEDTWPIGDVWHYHDLHFGQKDYCDAIDRLYGTPENLDDFCKKAQLVNYDSHRAMFESWNSKLWDNTSGLLLWMTHPAWPSVVWQVYSWDYETFGSYFGCQKACEPVHIQRNLHDGKVVIVNTSLHPVDGMASLDVYSIQGKKLFSESVKIEAQANQLTECFTPVIPENLPEIYLVRVSFWDKNRKPISVNDYWQNGKSASDFRKFNELSDAKISGKYIVKPGENGEVKFILKNDSRVTAIALKCSLADSENGNQILPAIFSDGYFNLLPGESREISLDELKSKSVHIVVEGYNLKSGIIL